MNFPHYSSKKRPNLWMKSTALRAAAGLDRYLSWNALFSPKPNRGCIMEKEELKICGKLDEVRKFPKGRLKLIKIGGTTIGRAYIYQLNSAMTGVWSLGRFVVRGSLSMQQAVHFSANGFVAIIWSNRQPRLRLKEFGSL
jgi:hypothetical protein